MPEVLTRPGTRKLSDVARHVVVPTGIVSTGYPAVRDKCRDIGVIHDDWQQGLGRLALGKREDGKYAATVGGVVLSIPRQVGKTFTIGSIIFALCLLFPNLTVIWTAHRTRTSNETFRAMQALARRSKVAPHIEAIRQTNGEQEIAFHNGSRIMFGAREQGFGRGFAEVDIEVFDEAQILTERALEDMIAATNQSRHPGGALLFYMGTPPRPVDPGEAFGNKRTRALSGKSTDMVYVELSADPDADPDDRAQWVKANPSYPTRTPLESMLRLRENVGSDESFIREGLGVWDEAVGGVIGLASWPRLSDENAGMVAPLAFAVAVSPDRKWASIGAAGVATSKPGRVHVEVVDRQPGTEWLLPRGIALGKKHPRVPFVIDDHGPAASLIEDFTAAKLTVLATKTADRADATEQFIDGVRVEKYTHGPDERIDEAIAAVKPRPVGDGRFVFGRRASDRDITALEVLPAAVWGASRPAPKARVINLSDVMMGATSAEQDVAGDGDV